MTDGEAVKVAARIECLSWQITQLCQRLATEHPNGQKMLDDLHDNAIDNPADARAIVKDCLLNPDAWETNAYGNVRYKRHSTD